MFAELIMECRAVVLEDRQGNVPKNLRLKGTAIERFIQSRNAKKKSKKRRRSVDERPEMVVGKGPLPKRGYDGTAPYSHPTASRSTIGSGTHGQSSHT